MSRSDLEPPDWRATVEVLVGVLLVGVVLVVAVVAALTLYYGP